jgi:hypothetical protein
MPPGLLAYFQRESCIFIQAGLNCHPPVHASHIAGMTGVCHHKQLLLVEMGVSQVFCPGQPQTTILLISAPEVAGIIGVSLHGSVLSVLIFHGFCNIFMLIPFLCDLFSAVNINL